MIPMVILPLLSIFSIFQADTPNFWNYTFPIISICIAGMYDSYSRYKPKQKMNIKLGIRVFIDSLVIIASAIIQGANPSVRLIPVVVLLLCGLFFAYESYLRVRTQIESSAWYRKGVE